jgi:hypothetical protein
LNLSSRVENAPVEYTADAQDREALLLHPVKKHAAVGDLQNSLCICHARSSHAAPLVQKAGSADLCALTSNKHHTSQRPPTKRHTHTRPARAGRIRQHTHQSRDTDKQDCQHSDGRVSCRTAPAAPKPDTMEVVGSGFLTQEAALGLPEA